jgi:hypothetical protein
MRKLFLPIALLLAISFVISACSKQSMSLQHVHGLGYTSDGKQILIPAHTGLVSYSGGKWTNVDAPKHDYMGFVAVDNGFYSSGHPEKGSKLKEPMGIVKSSDLGKTITTLGLDGESDFHAMTVGYKSHAIYVWSHAPNSKMNVPGLYYSKDDGKAWTKSQMNGVTGEPLTMAAHPTDSNLIALGTKDGVFLSRDNGNGFEVLPGFAASALSFGPGGDLFAAVAQAPIILQIDLSTKEQKKIQLPTMEKDDVVLYIAQNPSNAREIVIATFKKDVFLSNDLGGNWTQLADKGKTIE